MTVKTYPDFEHIKRAIADGATYYDVLDLEPSAIIYEIEHQYAILSKAYQTFSNEDTKFREVNEQLQKAINIAYAILKNPNLRKAYDDSLQNKGTTPTLQQGISAIRTSLERTSTILQPLTVIRSTRPTLTILKIIGLIMVALAIIYIVAGALIGMDKKVKSIEPRNNDITPPPLPAEVTEEIPVLTFIPTPTSIFERPTDGRTQNLYPGTTNVSPADGIVMVYIGGFWIDQTEVTNGMYALCVQAGVCPPPAEASSYTRADYFGNPSYGAYPVVKINYSQAQAYCSWAGRRLPTAAEWRKAAGKDTGSIYPWGNQIDCSYANIKAGGTFCVGDTTQVGSYPAGTSPLGVLDMAGNVYEWVAEGCAQGYSILGGCWNDGPEAATIDQSFCRTPDSTSSKLGFRCAK